MAGRLASGPLQHLLFDLDETLYPSSCGLMQEVARRMNAFAETRLTSHRFRDLAPMARIIRTQKPVIDLCGRTAVPFARPGHEGGLPAPRDQCPSASVQEALPEARRSVRSQARDHLRAFPHSAYHRGGGEVRSLRGLHAWNNVANPPILFAAVIARRSLRPRYGQGFDFGTQKDYEDCGNSGLMGRGR